MKDDWRNNLLPPPEGLEDRPDGFISVAILAFIILGPLIYFGPQLGALEAWLVDVYRIVDSWVAPVRDFVLG
ncbi:hypothetical protein BFN67_08730 [Pseudaminobacter manganicus]|uniref:Uncharacterized protein n=2 Tax=Manganibacter manganicus TaxID=1873176 RepID=A0A1V8RJT3_9HYPH|nr:hypothetical protein BFN67_08730 [Pseudaminobacter manganicus]